MLEFIDRFADPRFLGNPQLRCAAIWIGTTPDESALIDYLSPDDPGTSRFASDVGDEYDPDFLDAEHREHRPVDDVLAEIAAPHHLGPEDLAPLREAATRHDSTVANTHIILEQHVYRGAGHDFHGLVFVGNIEYQQPEPSSRQHLF